MKSLLKRFRKPTADCGCVADVRQFASHVADLNSKVASLQLTLDRFQNDVIVAALAPIDRHVTLVTALRNDGLFDESYAQWRTRRLRRLLAIYGVDYFRNKRVVELGAGLCEVGAFLADLGAEVTCLEGRAEQAEFAQLKHRKVANLRIECIDLEEDFSGYWHFDLMIHWGLLYHLNNIDLHLERCCAMADDICLESVVCDRLDPFAITYLPGRTEIIEESLRGVGCRPSPAYVERVAEAMGFEIERHFWSDSPASVHSAAEMCRWWPVGMAAAEPKRRVSRSFRSS